MGLKMGIGIGLNIFVVLLMACFKKFSKNFSQKNVESYYHCDYYIQKNIEHLLSSKKLNIQWQIYFVYVFVFIIIAVNIYVCI